MTTAAADLDRAVRAAAALLGVPLDEGDVPAVVEHFTLLMGFAAAVDDPEPEPAPVFRP